MGLLSELVVRFSADVSNLTSAFQKVNTDTATVVSSVKSAASAIKGLEGAADGNKIITNSDVMRAKLTIIESDIDSAKAKIKTLENAADAGQAVTGLDAAQAQLLLLEERAQTARDQLK